ncbi:MAG: VanZ family protein [bacterium]
MHTKGFSYYVPAILWGLAIFIGSSIPSHAVPSAVLKFSDLLLHFLEFTILGICLAYAFLHSPDRVQLKWLLIAAFVGTLYGASDELHQRFVNGRVSSFTDFLADSAGVLFGILLFFVVPRLFNLRNVKSAAEQ